jgi:hypothetical protein
MVALYCSAVVVTAYHTNPVHHNPDDYNIKSQITVNVMLPLTDLPCWYKGKVPTGQTDHLPSLFSDPGANWSLQQDLVNEHHQYVQLYQPIKSAVGKQIEPHKNLQKSFFKIPSIIPINDKHFLLGQQETAICCCCNYYYYYTVFVMKTMYNRFKGTHICAPIVKIKENTNKCTILQSCHNYSTRTLTCFLTLWVVNICVTFRLLKKDQVS